MGKKFSNKKVIQGRWYKINKKIKKKIIAKYHKIKDWKMDPKGYFLIAVDKNKKIIRVGYCKFTTLGNSPANDMVAEIKGKTAIEIVNTLIREKFISTVKLGQELIGTTKIQKKTKSMVFLTCELTTENKIVATASGVWKILKLTGAGPGG